MGSDHDVGQRPDQQEQINRHRQVFQNRFRGRAASGQGFLCRLKNRSGAQQAAQIEEPVLLPGAHHLIAGEAFRAEIFIIHKR